MMDFDLILLVLCLWSCVATGLAFMFWRQSRLFKFLTIELGKDLVKVATGVMEIKIVGREVIRTYKEDKHGV